ncbi:MAG: NAD(P)H-binding protein [Tepidisphaeraceae bacterium]
MRIAITGGTGFVGRNVARRLLADGHDVVLISRGVDLRGEVVSAGGAGQVSVAAVGIDDEEKLVNVLAGCDGVAHCAGINREIGQQTYASVHVQGTRNVVNAARRAGVAKVTLMSFIRARPHCGSPYHESKFDAEEIVRHSGLDYTILKAGVIYGRGDHMLDHLSHAFHTFPIFALVGLQDRPVRPTAVADVARIIAASLVDGRLSRQTVAVVGPEEMTLAEAVRRVASVVGKRPLMFRMPVWFHRGFAWGCERVMRVPLVSTAQVRMLAEGLTEPLPPTPFVPDDLAPRMMFTDEQIRAGLPEPGSFGPRDLRCSAGVRPPSLEH